MRCLKHMVFGLFLAALVGMTGCSKGKDIKAEVTGTVTLDGKDVAGEVYFAGEDGTELGAPSPITDGKYTVLNPKIGKHKILVKPSQGAPVLKDAQGVKPPKDMPSGAKEVSINPSKPTGVPPPAKYAKANELEYEVKSGKQTYDIVLKK